MKFSIVTPSFNSERYIAETIESVISQKGDFEIEYIIVDNRSTDDTLNIIKRYERMAEEGSPLIKCRKVTLRCFSEKDRGMYDAINKGFGFAAGDVFAWINSSDIYYPGALSAIQQALLRCPEVKWIKGITSFIDEGSNLIRKGKCYIYDREWIGMGIYGRYTNFIEQDSVFWRRELWDSVGGITPGLKLAGDYYLWVQFAKLAKLYTIKAYTSCFRIHEGQLSRNMKEYWHECGSFLKLSKLKRIKHYFILEAFTPVFLRPFMFRLAFSGRDFNLIEISGEGMEIRKAGYYIG